MNDMTWLYILNPRMSLSAYSSFFNLIWQRGFHIPSCLFVFLVACVKGWPAHDILNLNLMYIKFSFCLLT